MFDIGFWELVVIAIVALLVVGPDRLPGLARDAGRWAGRIRRLADNARHELERELRLTETGKYGQQLSDLDSLMHNAPDRDPDFNILQKPEPEKTQRQTPDQG